jgi:hypothetical protein
MNACLTRDTVFEHNCRASAIVSLELVLLLSLPLAPTLLSDAISRIRARVCTLAGLLPLLTNCLRVVRSSVVSLISGAVLILLVYQNELCWSCTERSEESAGEGKGRG